MQEGPPPIIDYQSPEITQEIPFLKQMMQWRSRCAWFLGGMFFFAGLDIFLPGFGPVATAVGVLAWMLCLAGILVCAILTLVYMGKAAATEVNRGYAARQVVLAVLLMPLLMSGIYLVPTLVKSDLLKCRRAEERKK